ncbi:MAG: SRPBCC family protein, partial [Pseudomonadota bacterium]
KGVLNYSNNHFEETSPGVTQWISDNEFRFSGLMMKIMGFVMPGAFKKQTRQMMSDFKAFAEEGKRVDEEG